MSDDGTHRPAHHRGRSRPRPERGPRDRRSLAARGFALVLAGGAVAAGVALGTAGESGGDQARTPDVRLGAAMPVMAPTSAATSTWYCTAGTAAPDGMADHTVVMANPGDEDRIATVTVVAGDLRRPGVPPAGSLPDPAVRQVPVAAGERVALRLGDVVLAPLAAAVVEVDGGGVAVEHQVMGPQGADVTPCSSFAAPAWHFAWGTTSRDARELVVFFNPFPSPATLDGVFMTEDGPREPTRLQGFPVPPRSVVGIDLGDDVTRSEQVAATFRARSGRVVVERVTQHDGSLGIRGLTLGLGAPEAASTWVFADGEASVPSPETPAPGADLTTTTTATTTTTTTEASGAARHDGLATSEKIVVYNPGDERAEVAVGLQPGADDEGGVPQPFHLTVAGGGYEVVDYGAQPRVSAGVDHATVVHATNGVPVVAERVTVDTVPQPPPPPPPAGRRRTAPPPEPPPGEMTATAGARYAARDWTFPTLSLSDGGTAGFAVYNPDPDQPVRVELRALGDAAEGTGVTVARVPPGGRATIPFDPFVAAAAEGVVVRAPRPVVVDRLVSESDGRRLALGPGVPALDGAQPLAAPAGG
jgi:Family of unknown function (DUF5719)